MSNTAPDSRGPPQVSENVATHGTAAVSGIAHRQTPVEAPQGAEQRFRLSQGKRPGQ